MKCIILLGFNYSIEYYKEYKSIRYSEIQNTTRWVFLFKVEGETILSSVLWEREISQ